MVEVEAPVLRWREAERWVVSIGSKIIKVCMTHMLVRGSEFRLCICKAWSIKLSFVCRIV